MLWRAAYAPASPSMCLEPLCALAPVPWWLGSVPTVAEGVWGEAQAGLKLVRTLAAFCLSVIWSPRTFLPSSKTPSHRHHPKPGAPSLLPQWIASWKCSEWPQRRA